MRSIKKLTYITGLFLTDAFVIYGAFWMAYETRFFCEVFTAVFPPHKGIPPWEKYQQALRAVIPIWMVVFGLGGRLYKSNFSNAADEFTAILKSTLIATLLIGAATFLYRQYEYSRFVIILGFLFSTAMLFLSREVWKAAIALAWDKLIAPETVLVLGEGKSIEAVVKLIRREPHKNLLVFAPSNLAEAERKIAEDPNMAEVYVSGRILQDESLQAMLDDCEERDVEIKVLPDLLEMRLGEVRVDDSLGLPILHLKPLSLHGLRFRAKRIFDVALSIAIIAVFFVPFVILALWIKLDSEGGVFFVQERMGFKENRFKCVKFRTMRHDAEKVLEELDLPSFRGGPAFKMKGDPRITRAGKFLRKFSLDEVPQIWNILRGEMSFIGPRPQVLAEAAGNPDWARKRYRILPGITGLWQVSGRADLSYEDMMRLDIYYLENWSPGLDLRIILRTIPVIMGAKGAY